jgi:hypothetical protein
MAHATILIANTRAPLGPQYVATETLGLKLTLLYMIWYVMGACLQQPFFSDGRKAIVQQHK